MPLSFLPARIGPLGLRCPLFALALGLAAPSMVAGPQAAPSKSKSDSEAKVQGTPRPVQSDHKGSGLGVPKLPEPKHPTKRTTKHHVNSEEDAQKHMRERANSKHAKPNKVIQRETPPRVTPPHSPTTHPGVPK